MNIEISTLRQQLEQVGKDTNPEVNLRAALQRQAEESRKQYEKCLDDVANQVVRALLAQKVRNINLKLIMADLKIFHFQMIFPAILGFKRGSWNT